MAADGAHFEIFPSADGHRWRLIAANGEPVAASEGYRDAYDAERGAMACAAAARDATTVYPTGGNEPGGLSIDARQVDE